MKLKTGEEVVHDAPKIIVGLMVAWFVVKVIEFLIGI